MRLALLAGLALAATGCLSLGGPPAQAGIHARLSYSDTAGLRLVEVPDGPAKEAGLHFIAGGHYATETLGVRALAARIAERFDIAWDFVDLPNPV